MTNENNIYIYYIQVMTNYHAYKVKLSKGQRQRLAKAYENNSAITIRLSKNELQGSDELMLTKTQQKKSKRP